MHPQPNPIVVHPLISLPLQTKQFDKLKKTLLEAYKLHGIL